MMSGEARKFGLINDSAQGSSEVDQGSEAQLQGGPVHGMRALRHWIFVRMYVYKKSAIMSEYCVM